MADTRTEFLVLDTGNLLFSRFCRSERDKLQGRLKSELIIKSYKEMGCAAVNVGKLDMVLGPDYLKKKEKDTKISFISANFLKKDTDILLFKSYIIEKIAGIKVGIFGLAAPQGKGVSSRASVLDPVLAARKIVPELKEKCDFLVALSNLGAEGDKKLAREVKGIDIIIGGHKAPAASPLPKPYDTLIFGGSRRGERIGRIDIPLPDSPDLPIDRKLITNRIILLEEKVAKDAKINGMIAEYKKEIAQLRKSFAPPRPSPSSSPPRPSVNKIIRKKREAAGFIGKDRCVPCHLPQYRFWQGTLHARAYSTLVRKNEAENPDCLPCHTTGSQERLKAGIEENIPWLNDVQCESCHGQRSKHHGKGEIKIVIEKETCLPCHNQGRDSEFNFDLSLPEIQCPGK